MANTENFMLKSLTVQNNGRCVDGVNKYTCECLAEFTGKFCEIEPMIAQMYPQVHILSLKHTQSFSVSPFVLSFSTLALSFSLTISLSLSLSHCLYLSLSLSLSVSVSYSLLLYIYIYGSSVSLLVNMFLSLTLSLPLSFSVSLKYLFCLDLSLPAARL